MKKSIRILIGIFTILNLPILTCHAQSNDDVSDAQIIDTVCDSQWATEGRYCQSLLKQHFDNIRIAKVTPTTTSTWRMPDYTYLAPSTSAPIPFYGTLEECKKASSTQTCYRNHP